MPRPTGPRCRFPSARRGVVLMATASSLLCLVAPVHGENIANALTIYSSAPAGAIPVDAYRSGGQTGHSVPGYAVVRHERGIDLSRGRNEIRFSDVAGLIDPTTVSFQSLTDPASTRVIEQNFQFDLVSSEKLLQKFVDRDIAVEQVRGDKAENFPGTLLSTQGGLVLKQADGSVRTFAHNASVTLPELPGGLITRPTLVWDLYTEVPGTHRARVAYQTAGITWWTDYNLVYTEGRTAGECRLDVGAWVSILNRSGASYPDARIKLIAGDVHRAPAAPAPSAKTLMRADMAATAEAPRGFEEKSFFEYHLYTLGRPSTLPDNSTKQIELFPAANGIACEKTLVYYGAADYGYGGEPYVDRNFGVASSRKVDTYLSFRNGKENGMGVPLPAGRVRVSKLDHADGTLEFIGEDRIDHTPRNETVLLKLGSAFDVVGERRQTDFKLDTSRKTMTEEFEIRIRNRKEEPVRVVVRETLYRWSSWRIVSSTHTAEKQDARTVHFPVDVAPDKEVVVRYAVRYSW